MPRNRGLSDARFAKQEDTNAAPVGANGLLDLQFDLRGENQRWRGAFPPGRGRPTGILSERLQGEHRIAVGIALQRDDPPCRKQVETASSAAHSRIGAPLYRL